MIKLIVYISALLLPLPFLFPAQVFAENNSFVTIVNPQRISEYTKDYLKSFNAQVNQIEGRGLFATWPITYDVLLKDDFVAALKNLDKKQELGIFLEVTPNFAKDAGVTYNKSNSWHRANSLFLTGYSQKDREKLIDTVFKKFKDEFGNFPKSVGAWYIDSYSLSYMQKKYGITSTINMSDQYDLDGYKLWGTPWSVPYYPSKINAAIPGASENKLDVLTLRWAARDPLNGYQKTGDFQPSLFSLQDYSFIGLSQSYYENLLKTFAVQNKYNDFGHAGVGLEGDLSPETYRDLFATQMEIVKDLKERGVVQILNMKDFAKWHKENAISPIHIIESQDVTKKTDKKAYWIQTPLYRIGITQDPKTKKTHVVDLRTYPQDLEEPFYKSPNKQFNLSINLPHVIDSVVTPTSSFDLGIGDVKNIEKDTLIFENGSLKFSEKEIVFSKNTKFSDVIKMSPYIKVSGNVLSPNAHFPTDTNGKTYMDFSLQIPFTIKRRLPVFLADMLPKTYLPIPKLYTISQTEMEALRVLKDLPDGRMLVYNRDCIDCSFLSKHKPAAAAGKKGYVKKYSGKKVTEDFIFSTAKSSKEAKQELKNKDITYVYLSKYEDYIESLPYLPQDLGLEKIYENANAEIWKVE